MQESVEESGQPVLDKHEDCKQKDLFHRELKSTDESCRDEHTQNAGDQDEVLKLVLTDSTHGNPK